MMSNSSLRRATLTALFLGAIAAPTASAADTPAPVYGADDPNAIPGQYIAVFDSASARNDAEADTQKSGGEVKRRYAYTVKGFSAKLNSKSLARLRAQPGVKYIEADRTVSINATQTNPVWGLDRIDQRALPLDKAFTTNATGAGVTAYIIDTGIRATHTEFAGRVTSGYTAISDGAGTNDCNGHGTHVSGTVGGKTYGVAKDVKLVAVRVLGCTGSGTNSGVIAGVDWVTSNHAAGAPAVANMSLGGGASTALDAAIDRAVADGVTVAVAAGNSNVDACNSSPARVPAAITVGASNSTDTRSSFSNYGACLDLFAPGEGIISSVNTSDTATASYNGTSMAAPHVAGAAALLLQQAPTAVPVQVRDALVKAATPNVIKNPGANSPNLLLFTGTGSVVTPPPATDPILNGSFESGNTSWNVSGASIASGTAGAKTGSRYASLGGGWFPSSHTVSQSFTVPNVTKAELKFWLKVTSSKTTANAEDILNVNVGSSTLRSYSNLNKGTSYVQQTIDLTAYKGQTVSLQFASRIPYWFSSSTFSVDDVSLAITK